MVINFFKQNIAAPKFDYLWDGDATYDVNFVNRLWWAANHRLGLKVGINSRYLELSGFYIGLNIHPFISFVIHESSPDSPYHLVTLVEILH